VHEEWFSDVEAVRKAVGLLEEPAPDTAEGTSKVRGAGGAGEGVGTGTSQAYWHGFTKALATGKPLYRLSLDP
jgi:hypothetical protein